MSNIKIGFWLITAMLFSACEGSDNSGITSRSPRQYGQLEVSGSDVPPVRNRFNPLVSSGKTNPVTQLSNLIMWTDVESETVNAAREYQILLTLQFDLNDQLTSADFAYIKLNSIPTQVYSYGMDCTLSNSCDNITVDFSNSSVSFNSQILYVSNNNSTDLGSAPITLNGTLKY